MSDPRETPQAGAQTRRSILRAGVCLLGTGAALGAGVAAAQAQTAPAAAPAPAAGTKLAQSAVMYQTHPNNGQLCSICVNFQAPNACAIVEGKINPVGWCVAFAPKA